jgi:hypothetical protein
MWVVPHPLRCRMQMKMKGYLNKCQYLRATLHYIHICKCIYIYYLAYIPCNNKVLFRLLLRVLLLSLLYSPWGETESTWYVDHCLAYFTAPDVRWWWVWSNRWSEWQGKPKYSECHRSTLSATLSTANPTWSDPGSNLGGRGEKPTTNRLNYHTSLCSPLLGLERFLSFLI